MAVIDFQLRVPEIGVSMVMVGILALVGVDLSSAGNQHTVSEMEDPTGLCPKGSEFVNFTRVGTVRKEHHVIICTHDFVFQWHCSHLIFVSVQIAGSWRFQLL